MKRFTTFVLILAVLLALPFSASWSKNTWSTVGQNPTTTSVVATLQKMDVSPEAIEFVKNNYPESTYVGKGMIFNEGSQGAGLIQKNVHIEYDSAKALVWRTGSIDVAFVLECNNVVWTPAGVIPAMPETPDSSSIVSPLDPLPVTKTGQPDGFFPAWFKNMLKIMLGLVLLLLALLALLALLWLLSRLIQHMGESGTTTPPTQPDPGTGGTTTVTPPVRPTPPIPPTPPTPPVQPVDELAELKAASARYLELKAELEKQRKVVLDLTERLFEKNKHQADEISAIKQSLEG